MIRRLLDFGSTSPMTKARMQPSTPLPWVLGISRDGRGFPWGGAPLSGLLGLARLLSTYGVTRFPSPFGGVEGSIREASFPGGASLCGIDSYFHRFP